MLSPIHAAALASIALAAAWSSQTHPIRGQADLDARVTKFLESKAGTWRDLNVPASDGQLLHDLIVEHRFTRALEIGTSTGHSGIWIAWALSRTGGRLITIELDPGRHREAVANFEAAGLSRYIDARLGNAHDLVPALEGPFDFVFSDADKDWYPNYFTAVLLKLAPGGCYTSHNVSETGRRGAMNSREYLALLRATPGTTTTVDETGGGLAITCRTQAARGTGNTAVASDARQRISRPAAPFTNHPSLSEMQASDLSDARHTTASAGRAATPHGPEAGSRGSSSGSIPHDPPPAGDQACCPRR